jgi:hypothetical protein
MSSSRTSRFAKFFAVAIVASVLVTLLPDVAFAAKPHRSVAPSITGGAVPNGFVDPGSTLKNTVTFSGAQGQVDGSASFFLCGPKQPKNDSNVFPDGCTTGGTQIGDAVPLMRGSATSANFTDQTKNGHAAAYCWRVEFTPAAGSPYDAQSYTNSTSQCVIAVLQVAITTLSTPTGSGVAPGTTAYDTATITNDVMKPPGKMVDFFLCSPVEITVGVGCVDGGTKVGSDQLSGSKAVSPTTKDTMEPGTYCWRAEYRGGFSPPDSIAPGEHTNWTTECFTIVGPKAIPTMLTVSNPTGGDITPGTAVVDTATVTGTSGTPTGTVDFFLCGPDEATAAGCPSGGKLVGTKTLGGDGVAVSPATSQTTLAGTYCWRAEYSGDNAFAAAQHTNATTECFEILSVLPQLPSSTATVSSPTGTESINVENLPVILSDTAMVTGEGVTTPTGSITFFLCGTGQGTPATAAGCPVGGAQIGGPVTLTAAGVATSATIALTTAGTYCWRAEYSGDASYLPSMHTNGTTECFIFSTVKGAPPIKPRPPLIVLPGTGVGPTGFGFGIAFLAVGLVLISLSRREMEPEMVGPQTDGPRIRPDRGVSLWNDRHRRPRRSTGPPRRAGPNGVHG